MNVSSVTHQAKVLGSQGTLTSKTSLSHHTASDLTDDERSLEHDEIIKDCNGRIVPRLMIRAPTMDEVSHVIVICIYECFYQHLSCPCAITNLGFYFMRNSQNIFIVCCGL